jgi:catechol 2,3-dioxygenase-like lactoylglutathione lyase family enzyme
MGSVRELRLVLTVADFDAALAFYRDALGLEELDAWEAEEGGRIAILAAGDATIELVDEGQARAIDAIEVGKRVAGPVRLALEVADSAAMVTRLSAAGATVLAGPIETPWKDRNVRLLAPGGMQLTLFTVLDD